jgi:hypothetical protein
MVAWENEIREIRVPKVVALKLQAEYKIVKCPVLYYT